MLTGLSIKNVAVIDKLTVDFHGGVTVLTGETGAGKSIIIDSINMILGDRANREAVRFGSDEAVVQAVFDAPESIQKLLADNDIDAEDGELIITRRVTADGKSSARVNGMAVTLNVLREISDSLVNIHGQHDNQALLTPSRHMGFLDAYADDAEQLDRYKSLLAERRGILKKLDSLKMDEREKMQRMDLLEYQINEIKGANLAANEEEELTARRTVLANAEQIKTAIDEAYANLYGGDEAQPAYDGVSIAADALSRISGLNPRLNELYEAVNTIMYTMEDAAHEIKEYGDGVEYDERELNETEERLETISRLKRKYGGSVQAVLDYLAKAESELDDIKLSDEKTAELTEKLNETTDRLRAEGKKLTDIRKKAAADLEKRIETSLGELNMEKARFCVSVESADEFYDNGMDKAEFLISANPGEPLKPLVKIASGGELSRVMLAIKSILADTDEVGTLIFDEIDTGVSGRAAVSIAEKLKGIGKNKQVICITHLPQLAAAADNHYLIQKNTDGEMASTTLTELDERGREEELARIIDGREVSDLALKHARQMLSDARG